MFERPEAAAAIAERIKTAFEAADLSAFSDLLDPQATWGPPDAPSPTCQNRDQVLAWYERGRQSGTRARVSEIAVLGNRILVGLSVERTQTAPESGGAAQRWQVLTLGGGRIVDIIAFDERAEAVARARGIPAPGQPEHPPRWVPPRSPLADDRITVRLPQPSDAWARLRSAGAAGGIEGVWVPLAEGASLESCKALIDDWLTGWWNLPSFHGPALVIVEAGQSQMVGQVGLRARGAGPVVELVYGVAPNHRGRGYATRAVGLVASWLFREGLAGELELHLDKHNTASQRVAAKAGFTAAGTVVSQVKATGDTYEDLRFV